MTIQQQYDLQRMILDYEVRASLWAPHLPFQWMRAIAAIYITGKARRKFHRWMQSLELTAARTNAELQAQQGKKTP